jgi:3',5'-cyclic AMP phosphodiesterase CpdA
LRRADAGPILVGADVLRLVHLSDLHHQIDWRKRPFWSSGWRGAPGRFELHALGRLRRFTGVEQRIARLVDQVLALCPDRVLLTGDLTALGDAAELEHARALLQPFHRRGAAGRHSGQPRPLHRPAVPRLRTGLRRPP